MKKFISIIVILSVMTSCSPIMYSFRQIGILTSNNVEIKDNGAYEYSNHGLTISYNFWSYGGEVSFAITNNSNEDVYLLKDQCFFIQNNLAQDYYKNRVYVEQESHSSSSAYTGTSSISKSVGKTNYDLLLWGNSSSNKAATQTSTTSTSFGFQRGYAIETTEAKTICIPANSTKYFSEFSISEIPYRQCGFARDTDEYDGTKISFLSASTSPQNFENRLVFKIGDKIVPIVNTFYVSEYINIYDGEGFAYISTHTQNCKGENKEAYPDKKVYKHAKRNSFYTTYTCAIGIDNDVIK